MSSAKHRQLVAIIDGKSGDTDGILCEATHNDVDVDIELWEEPSCAEIINPQPQARNQVAEAVEPQLFDIFEVSLAQFSVKLIC